MRKLLESLRQFLLRLIPTHRYELVIFDDVYPRIAGTGFRTIEYASYMEKYDLCIYTIPQYKGEPTNSVGKKRSYFQKFLPQFKERFPSCKSRMRYLSKFTCVDAELAYILFLNNAYAMLDYLETQSIPFVFCLYPGGGFFVDDEESDRKLRLITSSVMFRGVITTQNYTRRYLLDRSLCPGRLITHIYGGFTQISESQVVVKKRFPNHKPNFDICFVAYRYMPQGVNKGYDIFVQVAKKLAELTEDIRFHVVGNWDKNEIDVSEINDEIKFYGALEAEEFPDFYSSMDIFLSPNRPFELNKQFDGFPLGADAGFCGSALFVADELKENHMYVDDEDIVIVSTSVNDIVARVIEYYKRPDELYRLSERCQKKTQYIFDINRQMHGRLACIENARR